MSASVVTESLVKTYAFPLPWNTDVSTTTTVRYSDHLFTVDFYVLNSISGTFAPIPVTLETTGPQFNSNPAESSKTSSTTSIGGKPNDHLSSTSPAGIITDATTITPVLHTASPAISSSSQPSYSTNRPSRNGSGVLAGIGAGCAVAGVILGALLFWLFFCRRRHRKGQRVPNFPPRTSSTGEKGYSYDFDSSNGAATSSSKPLPLEPIYFHDAAVLAPLDEFEIVGDMMKLNDAIEYHARSYYAPTSQGFAGNSAVEDKISSLLGPRSSTSSRDLVGLYSGQEGLEIAIQFLLAWTILHSAQTSSSPENTLLPPHLSECMEDMKSCALDDETQSMYFSKWRQLTATLLHSAYDGNSIESNDTRLINIQELLHKLNGVLEPYSTEASENDRLKNLHGIIKDGAIFGYKLFKQPADWSFDWNGTDSNHGNAIVVFPALIQVSDEEGHRLVKPKRHTNAKIVYIDSENIGN